jgi:hypothetical protein
LELGIDMSKGMSVDTKGVEETLAMFEQLSDNAEAVMKQCVYKGAGKVADTMKEKVEALRTGSGKTRKELRYCYDYEKQALIYNLGIAPIKGGDNTNTKVGFDGYYDSRSGVKKPVPLLANSINAGTSFMKKQAFITSTKRASESACVEAMQKQIDKAIEKVQK